MSLNLHLHLYLIMACIFGIEVLSKSGFLSRLNNVVETAKKVSHIIIAANISDHWKEKMVPTYAFIILKNSSLILAILIAIILVFFCFSLISNELIAYTLSMKGILESVIVAYVYIKVKSFLVK